MNIHVIVHIKKYNGGDGVLNFRYVCFSEFSDYYLNKILTSENLITATSSQETLIFVNKC